MFDYHTHSNYSPDGHDSIIKLLQSAEEKGLKEICITDHCDIEEDYFDSHMYWSVISRAKQKNPTNVKLLLGIELGQPLKNEHLAKEIITSYPFDFVICSVHSVAGADDFYYCQYQSEEHCYDLLKRYIDELCKTVEFDLFDVLGHITYPLRYMETKAGFKINALNDENEHMWRTLFEKLKELGKGIELNASGLYTDFRKTMPERELLELYKSCGGEIITVGSDAHYADKVGCGISEGIDLLRDVGFTNITTYEKHKPTQVLL